jgi:hypothetical protein
MHTLANVIISTARQLLLLRGCQLFVFSDLTLNTEIISN